MLAFENSTGDDLIYINHSSQVLVACLRLYNGMWGLYNIDCEFCLTTSDLRQIADKLDELNSHDIKN